MKKVPLTRKTPLKRSPLLRKTGDAYHFRKRKKIPAMSQKRKKEGAEYSKLRKTFLLENPKCHSCIDALADGRQVSPVRPATQVHHKAGRGRFYLRVDTWLPVCHSCHEEITKFRPWAESQGYSLTIAQRRALP